MNETNRCPKCGQPVPPDAPEGLCPRCLGALNLDTGTGISGSGAAAAPPPPSAAELAPHFPQLEILELIGKGGMGVVYKVRQKELDRIAALKILPPGIGGDPAFAERFAREAKALAKLNHPGIVTIYDSGRTDGLYYFLMEFVDGVSLGRLMRGGRVSPREALAIVPQICDALQYAHDQGIVHRDIKPENILLDRQGRVKVADFGLAKLMGANALSHPMGEAGVPAPGESAPVLTEAGKVMGTPQYMAPEQAEHPGEVDHRADIYALGVVFYEMLTGELPGKRIEPPSRKVQIDVHLDEIVLRALEREPERRYQTAGELKTVVETVVAETLKLTGAGSSAPGTGPGTVPLGTRWSRAAIAGALGIGFFLLVIVLWLADWPPSRDPSFGRTLPQVLFRNAVLPAGWAALFAGTILGWIAVTRIRRSSGRLRGLGLAAFEGLFLPLLTVDLLILLVSAFANKALAAHRGLGGSMFRNLWDFALFCLLIGLMAGWADYLIIRPVWRRINGKTSGDARGSNGRTQHNLRLLAAAIGLAVIFTVPAYMILNENSRKARYGWAVPAGTELHYQVFEADAAQVNQLVPFQAREPGNALASAGIYTKTAPYTAVAQMAEIDDASLTALLHNPATKSGLLANVTKQGDNLYQWWPDAWSYNTADASGQGKGFCGMGRDMRSVRFRIRYLVSHKANDSAPYPVTAEISYEGKIPPQGKARAFFIPFGRDQEAKYLVIVFTAKTASKGPTSEPPAGQSPPEAVPTNRTAMAGSTASFQVEASGTAPLSYQWRFNDTNQTAASIQSDKSTYVSRLTRIVKHDGASSPAASPPTVEQILAYYAQAKGAMAGADKTQTLTMKGVFTSRDGLSTMQEEVFIKAPDKWLMVLKGTNGPVWQRGFDGAAAWEISQWGKPQVDSANLVLARIGIGIYRGDPLSTLLPKMSFKGMEPIGGGQAYVVEVALPGQPLRLWFDPQSGLLVRIEWGGGGAVLQMDWEDYRDIGGLLVPFKVREAGTENWLIQCSEVKRNEPIDDNLFKRPAQ